MIATADGVVIVDKPEGMTSHDVVAAVRRRLPRTTRVGHTGTLDPFATGVLPVVIGKATRLSQFLTAGRKRYRATVAFGTATDTGDRMGTVIETASSDVSRTLNDAALGEALATFAGLQAQVPPAHSAKKVGGERAYVLARRGGAIDLPPVEVTAHALTLANWDAASQTALVDLDVSAGYYVRSLARDLGARLGVPAHLSALRRTGSGSWSLADARPLADVLQSSPEGFAAMCQPMSSVLQDWPSITVDSRQLEAVRLGRLVVLDGAQAEAIGKRPLEHRVRLLDEAGALVALGLRGAAGTLHADIVLR